MTTKEKEENKLVVPCYAMATNAMHQLGDISSAVPDLCYLKYEAEDHYTGQWVTGFGFVDVMFPKETTRALTHEEVEKYNKLYVQIANHPPIKLKVD